MRDLWRKFTYYFVPAHGNAYRPHLLTKQWLILFFTIVLTAEGVAALSFVAKHSAFDQSAAIAVVDVIAFTNVERIENKASVLRENPLLDIAAQAKAYDMATKGYFSHNGPDGKEPWVWIKESGYSYRYAGENLAVRFDDSANVVNAWMASPTHRANIVKPVYTEIGVGVAEGMYEGTKAKFVVQYFGTPLVVEVQQQEAVAVSDQSPTVALTDEETTNVQGAATAQEPTPTTTSTSGGDAPLVIEPQVHPDTVTQQVVRAVAESGEGAPWILGGIATTLLALLTLAFFIHIEVQSHEAMVGGGLVLASAVLFLILNIQLPTIIGENSQGAAVAGYRPHVMVGEDSNSTENIISPLEAPQTPPIDSF